MRAVFRHRMGHMLILMRRKGETIRIGGNVTVTVLGIAGSQVRVGVEAPKHVVVDREEVHQRRASGCWAERKPNGKP